MKKQYVVVDKSNGRKLPLPMTKAVAKEIRDCQQAMTKAGMPLPEEQDNASLWTFKVSAV